MKCKNIKCNKEHDSSFGSGKYCSRACANSRNWSNNDKIKKGRTVANDKKRFWWKEFILNEFENKTTIQDLVKKLNTSLGCFKSFCKRNEIDFYKYRGNSITKINPFVKKFTGSLGTVKEQIKKRKLLNDKKCCVCNIETWQGKEIKLELDHIDGDRFNNELTNLRYLCPNCHSQTDTFRSKNYKYKRKVSDEEFIKALKENKTINAACKSLGIPSVKSHYTRALKLKEKYNLES